MQVPERAKTNSYTDLPRKVFNPLEIKCGSSKMTHQVKVFATKLDAHPWDSGGKRKELT